MANFFDISTYSPHGLCLLWRPDLIWATVLADAATAVSYFSIPVALVYFVLKRKDLVFRWIFMLFGAFILLCGSTHIVDVITIWLPIYGWEAVVKSATAMASVATAVVIWPLMPNALALPGTADLTRINSLLAQEAKERRTAEAQLRSSNSQLEARVQERTAALTRLTEELKAEIAERTRVEEGLRNSTNVLQATLDAAPFPICVESHDETIIMWNKAAERDLGYASDEMIGNRLQKLYPGDHQLTAKTLYEQALQGKSLRNIPTALRDRNGKNLSINLSSAPVREPNGQIHAVVYAIEDQTQRISIEAQLRQAQKMEAIGNLTGGMAHDFNNLLAIILGNLDCLDASAFKDLEQAGFVNEAIDAALRGADLTRRLLAFARRQPLNPEDIDLNDHITRVMNLLRRILGEDILLEMTLSPEKLSIRADPAQLDAAVTNLATNARDAMPRGGTLMIRTTRAHLDSDYAQRNPEVQAGDYAMAEICDTGAGIDPEIATRIFEPFVTTKEEGKGSGLGLAMVFGFIKQSGGHINVYSEVGKGACFRLYLPLRTTADAASSDDQKLIRSMTGHEHILIVEDNDRLRKIVAVQLRALGYQVSEVSNAFEAMALLRHNPDVNLLFTDIVMPGEINGSDLAHAVAEFAPSVRIVLTSGFPEARTESSGWNGGKFKLLTKPYRRDDLAMIVRSALDAG